MDDELTEESEWVVPAGAPLRVYEWLLPPLLPAGVAVIAVLLALRGWPSDSTAFFVTVVPFLLGSAVALLVFGYRAYRDLTLRAVEQYELVATISVAIAGLSLSFGYFGVIFLILAGRLAAGQSWRPLRILRARMPRRLWKRTAIIAAVVGILSLLLFPVALGLELTPLIGLLVVGRAAAALIYGFAARLRPSTSGLF